MKCSMCGCDAGSDFKQTGSFRLCSNCSGDYKEFVSSPTIEVKREETKFAKLHEDAIIPVRATSYSAGYDIHALGDYVIRPGQTKLIKTGITAKIPRNMYLAIHSRSGLAFKHNVSVLNSPGVVDADYFPNEIGVILHNASEVGFIVNSGDRIAQGLFNHYYLVDNDESNGVRNSGFGSTGVAKKE